MTIRGLLVGLTVLWVAFGALSLAFPPAEVFHHINALAVSAAIVTVAAYSPTIKDAWRVRHGGITASHLLGFGIVANWIGFAIRLGRWFITNAKPTNGIPAWAYNVGLFVTITAAGLLVGALALTPPKWSSSRIFGYATAFCVLTTALWMIDYLS